MVRRRRDASPTSARRVGSTPHVDDRVARTMIVPLQRESIHIFNRVWNSLKYMLVDCYYLKEAASPMAPVAAASSIKCT